MASEAQEELTTLAVLIDADNLSPALASDIFETACKLGKPIVRRAYGIVSCFSCAEGWSKPQREYGIVACPQVSNIAHKNVADIALVIDAMELLYKGHCQGFCIVSSDSDFTALVAKIREAGKLATALGTPSRLPVFVLPARAFSNCRRWRRSSRRKRWRLSPSAPDAVASLFHPVRNRTRTAPHVRDLRRRHHQTQSAEENL